MKIFSFTIFDKWPWLRRRGLGLAFACSISHQRYRSEIREKIWSWPCLIWIGKDMCVCGEKERERYEMASVLFDYLSLRITYGGLWECVTVSIYDSLYTRRNVFVCLVIIIIINYYSLVDKLSNCILVLFTRKFYLNISNERSFAIVLQTSWIFNVINV